MSRPNECSGPPLPDETVLERPLSEVFTRAAREKPDEPFLVSLSRPDESYEFGRFEREARRIASSLVALGIRPGDRVSILSENRPRWCAAYVAVLHAGAVVVPIDAQLGPPAIHAVLEDAGSVALFVSAELTEHLPALEALGWTGSVLCLDEEGAGRTWDELVRGTDSELPELRGGDVQAALLYTSGTTGSPKGVVLTHANLQAITASVALALEFRPSDRLIMFLPLQHVLSQIGSFILPATLGLRVVHAVIQSGEDLLGAVRKGGVTILLAVPLLFHLIHDRIESQLEKASPFARAVFRGLLALNGFSRRFLRVNLGRSLFGRVHGLFGSQLRFLASGGSALDGRVQRDFLAMGFDVIQAYGMTETAGGVTVQPVGDLTVGVIGRPLPGATLRIEQPDENGVGEICARGPMITPGYHGRPDATADLLKDGWLHTGDLGRFRERGGLLEVTGRIKEIIVLDSGKNIYPEDLENHYQRSPWIDELCVLGIDSGDQGEKLHAVVVPDWERVRREGVTAVREMLRFEIENLSSELPSYQRVLSFEVRREPLPRTPTRKLRRFLVEPDDSGGAGEAPALPPDDAEQAARLASEAGRVVADLLAHRLGPDVPVQARSSFELDLGLDSLNRMEFLLSVEQALGVSFTDEEAARLHDVDELIQLAQQQIEGGDSELTRRPGGWRELIAEAGLDDLPPALRARRSFLSYVPLQALVWLDALFMKLFFRLKGEGREHLPATGPFLLCPTHVSFLDAFLVSPFLPTGVIRHIFVLGEAEYFTEGLAGAISRWAGIVPTNPNLHLRLSMRAGAAGLKQGRALIIFPEGTRSADGRLQQLKMGAPILATELDLPIIPAVVKGAYEAWPRAASGPKWFSPCRVRFGPPLKPSAIAGGLEGEAAQQAVAEALRRALLELGAPPPSETSAPTSGRRSRPVAAASDPSR